MAQACRGEQYMECILGVVMTKVEAKNILEKILFDITQNKISLNFHHDLQKDNILDSLNIFVFFMEVEIQTGLVIPETTSLAKDGWYKIEKLCDEIVKKHENT